MYRGPTEFTDGDTEDLTETLAIGNSTGGTDIAISATDVITTISGDLTLESATDIIQTTGELRVWNSTLGAGDYLRIFDDGTASYLRRGSSGQLVLMGDTGASLIFIGTSIVTMSHTLWQDDISLRYGTGQDATISYSTIETNDALLFTTGATAYGGSASANSSAYFIFAPRAHNGSALSYDHPAGSHPVITIHSTLSPTTDNSECIEISYSSIRAGNAINSYRMETDRATYELIMAGVGASTGAVTNTTGGSVTINSGQGANTSGAGGAINITSGAGGSVSGNSGAVTIRTGAVTSGTAGVLELGVGNTSNWRINQSGDLLAISDNSYDIGASGATRPRTGYYGTSLVVGTVTSGLLNISDTSAPANTSLYIARTEAFEYVRLRNADTDPAGGQAVIFQRSRGTIASPALATDGDKLGAIGAQQYVSAGPLFATSASVEFYCDGTPSATSAPGRISFRTTPTGAVGTTERWRITSAGHLLTGAADNTYDIGATGATRPRRVYVGTEVIVGSTVTIGTATITGSGALSLTATSAALALAATGTNNITLDTNATNRLTISTTQISITNADITCVGAGASSEKFGAGALAAGSSSVAIGNAATAAGVTATAVGSSASASNTLNTAVGSSAAATGTSSATAIGAGATASASNTLAIGRAVTVAHTGSIAIGYIASTTAANQFVIGSSSSAITTTYIGNGVTNAAPSGTSINATGGSGTDITGAALTLAGGRGTGNAAGGDIDLQTTLSGQGTATTLRTLVTPWRIAGGTGHLISPTDNTYDIGATGTTRPRNLYIGTSVFTQTVNNASSEISTLSENLTLNTGGTTTDTTIQLPADSIIIAVTARVTTTIATATDWKVGDLTTNNRFIDTQSTLTAGTTAVGIRQMFGSVTTDATGPAQTTAASVRVTTTGTPSAGAIRLTIHFIKLTAPTS